MSPVALDSNCNTPEATEDPRYDAAYFQGNNQAGDRPALRWYARVVGRLAQGVPGRAKIFEFGCGVGWMLHHLAARHEVAGFDISEYCRQETARRVLSARIFDAMESAPSAAFDGVVALHVLEHIERPAGPLKTFARLLKPGGFLLFVVPAADGLGHRLKREKWMGYRDPTHVSLLKSPEWAALCGEAGFVVESMHGDGLWDPPYVGWLPRLVQWPLFGAPAAAQVYLGRGRLFLPVSWSEDLIMICRRKD